MIGDTSPINELHEMFSERYNRPALFLLFEDPEKLKSVRGGYLGPSGFEPGSIVFVSTEEERICLHTIRETQTGAVVPKLDETIKDGARDVTLMVESLERIIAFMRSPQFEIYEKKNQMMREVSFIIKALERDRYSMSKTNNLNILVEAASLSRLCQSAVSVSSAIGSKS